MIIFKKTGNSKCWENVEKLDSSYFVGKHVKLHNLFVKEYSSSSKRYLSSYHTILNHSQCVFKIYENVCPHEDMYMNVCSNIMNISECLFYTPFLQTYF